jgi:beta-lactamase regulating signal transducer with metallopeptidase domain
VSAGLLAGATLADAVELLVRATLLIGAAWASAAALGRAGASASARHMAWLLGIAAVLLLPLLWATVPALRLPILAAEAPAPAPAGLPTAMTMVDDADSGGWVSMLIAAYGAGAILLLLRIALLRQMLSRLWQQAEPAHEPAWEDLLRRVSGEIGLRRRVELRLARGATMPMTWGTLSPRLLLPAEAEAWPAERRRLVLLHELAHVARSDSLARSAASLACALYWFHPGVWLAARRMRLEQEHAADDRVLSAGAPARSYALSLVALARRTEAGAGHAAAMAGMEQLERRLVSITGPARRDRPGAAFLASSAALAACVTLLVSAGAPVRAARTLPEPLPGTTASTNVSTGARVSPPPRRETRPESQTPAAEGMAVPAPVESAARDVRAGAAVARPILPAGPAGAPVADEPGPANAPRAPGEQSGFRQDGPAVGHPRPSPVDGPQLAAYGPQLPAAISDRDSDARIPELARRSGRSDPDQAVNRRGRWALPIQVIPNEGSVRMPMNTGLVELVLN